MAVGPAPCLTICRKPRVLGLAGASRAATPEPEGWALIVFGVLASPCGQEQRRKAAATWPVLASTAAARAAAVFAFVAGAVGHHQHAALAARGPAFIRVGRHDPGS